MPYIEIAELSVAHAKGDHLQPIFGCDLCGKAMAVNRPSPAVELQTKFEILAQELGTFRDRLDRGLMRDACDDLLDRAESVEIALDDFLSDYEALRLELGSLR